MPAYLVAFPDDPDEKEEYECKIVWRESSWVGTVNVRTDRKVKGEEGFDYWEILPYRSLHVGLPCSSQKEAADSARKWCKDNGISYYMGPIISGMIAGPIISGFR